MKKSFLLAAALSICILFSVAVNSGNAAVSWYSNCVVGGAGTQGGVGLVYVSTGGSNGTSTLPVGWYSMGANTTEANQGLATALTAVSTGATATILVDPLDGRFWPLITGILVTP
jgi:hypothetical protein